MSNCQDDQQQAAAVGNSLAEKHKRHSSGEHVNSMLKVKAQEDDTKVRRKSSPAFHSQQIVSNPRTRVSASHSGKPQLPPHPSLSPELARLIHAYKTRTPSNDIHVIDSRSKNPPQVSTASPVPSTAKSTKCPPKRPDPPKQLHHAQAPSAPAPDPPKQFTITLNPRTLSPPSPTPPPPSPSPPPSTTNSTTSKRIPARKAPPPPNNKASSKTKATVHKPPKKISLIDKPSPSEKVLTNSKATTPVHKKISVDSKIAPLLAQFERAFSNEKLSQIHAPAVDSVAPKPHQSLAVPKSQSTDTSSHDKTTFPKSHSSDLALSSSTDEETTHKLQSTDPPKTEQFPKSHSSTVLKTQKSIIPKSRSSAAVLKSQKSFLRKQNQSTSKRNSSSSLKKDQSTSKPPSKTWKPKNSKLQALFKKAERRKRKKVNDDIFFAAEPPEDRCTEKVPLPIDAIYAVVQRIHLDDSPTSETAALYQGTREETSQTPGCWIPPDVDLPTSRDLDEYSKGRQPSVEDVVKFSIGREGSSQSCSTEDLYASLKKNGFKPKEEELLPPLPPRLYENIFDDPDITGQDDGFKNDRDMERNGSHHLKVQLQESMDNTYAVMHNPRNKAKSIDAHCAKSGVKEELNFNLPPLPSMLYENIFDDPSIAEHDEKVRNGHSDRHSKAQLQESMDNTYAVMHNPRSKVKADHGAKASNEEVILPPPLPPKLYENVFDDPAILEHNKHEPTKGLSEEEELPPPLPPKLYENIFDDPIIAEHQADRAINGEQEELAPPPLPPKMYVNVFDDATTNRSGQRDDGIRSELDLERKVSQMNGATSHDLKAQLQESADNTYAVMHNPRSKGKGESAKCKEQDDIYIVMHPHPAFMPLIKKYFKNQKPKSGH